MSFLFGLAYESYEVFCFATASAKGYTDKVSADKGSTDKGGKPGLIHKASGSLEALHNLYHGLIGGNTARDGTSGGKPIIGRGGGHMSEVSVAAFDPIFVSAP